MIWIPIPQTHQIKSNRYYNILAQTQVDQVEIQKSKLVRLILWPPHRRLAQVLHLVGIALCRIRSKTEA